MNLKEYMKNNILILDGGMGTLLQQKGLRVGELPEKWNISHSKEISSIHKEYYDAGCNVVNTNTFGANTVKFSLPELEKIICAAVENAKCAREASTNTGEKYIALDIGPSGKLLKPYGDFEFEEAVKSFAQTVKLGVKYGVDLIFIETFSDSYETKAALLAAKENCSLPVFVSNAYGEDGKLMTGASPEAMVALCEGMDADAIGANCSLGPDKLKNVIDKMLSCSSVPIILKPNAGLPRSVNGETVYDINEEKFSDEILCSVKNGVRIVGGCCGTTPKYISLLSKKLLNTLPVECTNKNITCISSYTHAVNFGAEPILIGERINPTGKKRFKQALQDNDIDYILHEGINQQDSGVHVLDVNVGLPEIDEVKMLESAVFSLQSVIDLPLQIDTANLDAMEKALRIYNGKPLINSVNGKVESMKTVFPLAKKYGGVVIALTLDDNGIPADADGRVEIAKNIISVAKEYGIDKKNLIFDTLAMTVSADSKSADITLDALSRISKELKCKTSLGISNISFGLPMRDSLNSTFFALALERGLSSAIMNPYSSEMMKVYYSYRLIHSMDKNCTDYIDYMSKINNNNSIKLSEEFSLKDAVEKGLKEKAGEVCRELLKDTKPLDIINNEIIPALDAVGRGFEQKSVYLPQLLMSAEAAKSAFECIKEILSIDKSSVKCDFIIATVQGDIHDIGKNIVKLLLENYGFNVHDLGKDVSADKIIEKAVELHCPIVGLSALMTTTVVSMEQTISLLKKKAPWCKIVVGGAVLTKEYASAIGADMYASDAMETVRYAEKINEIKKNEAKESV